MVSVLVLIDQDMAELLLIPCSNLRKCAQQVHRLCDQIIEVKGVVSLQLLGIGLEYLGDDSLPGI